MAKRIDRTRPFISNTRPVDRSNYKLKRRMQRANEEKSSDLKLKSTSFPSQITTNSQSYASKTSIQSIVMSWA